MEDQPTTGPDTGRDTSRYTLSVEEASDLFARAGVPRSPRSVQRYCKHSVLDAIAIDTDANEKYLIEPSSVQRRITELKQVLQSFGERRSSDATRRDMSGHDATRRDESRQDATRHDNETGNTPGSAEATTLKEMIAKLKSENDELRFDARVNRELARFVQQQNRDLIDQVSDQSRTLGRLEVELRLLDAPRNEAGDKDFSILSSEVRDAAEGDSPTP